MGFFDDTALSRTRQKILNSALVLFVEKGFFNTSIPDLVAHSGVSTGSIYHAFKDKQALASALMAALLEKVEHDQAACLQAPATAQERFFALAKWLLQMAEAHPKVMQFILYARHKEFLPGVQPLCSSKPFLNLRDVIAQGQAAGEVRPMDVMVASALAYGGVLRFIQLFLDGLVQAPLMTHYEELTQSAWRAIKADGDER